MRTNIKQFRHCQMWTVDGDKVYSYNTLVGLWDYRHNIWVFTETSYSRTTSKQIGQYRNENGGIKDEPRFLELVEKTGASMHEHLCVPREWWW